MSEFSPPENRSTLTRGLPLLLIFIVISLLVILLRPKTTTSTESSVDEPSSAEGQRSPNETGETTSEDDKPEEVTSESPGAPTVGSNGEELDGGAEPRPTSGGTRGERIELSQIEERGDRSVVVSSGKKVSGDVYTNYGDGSPKFFGGYKNGLKHGLHQTWYRDGNPKHSAEYSNGRRHGEQSKWNEDGTLRWKEVWTDGKKVD